MRQVEIKELRRHVDRYLNAVQDGETIQVVDRGHPVARLVPLPQSDAIEDPVSSGELAPSSGNALDLVSPIRPVEGKPMPSEVLAADRAGER
jgi:prevent-host-death family protein